jgi:hypothetical protein
VNRPSLDELLGAVRTELRLQLAADVLPVGCDAKRLAVVQHRAAVAIRVGLQERMESYLARGGAPL